MTTIANHDARELPGAESGAGIGSPLLPTDIMVAEVSRLLATPGFLGQSVTTLRRADSAFDVLDGLMRSGVPLPFRWPVNGEAERHESVTVLYDSVTVLYDSVSESLREVGGVVQSFGALRSACALWGEFDAALRAGAPLPEPWQRQR
ncbi:hypothetical protein ACWFMI_20760 [Nocardiopsis terrae]